jgi:hypothetical protein
MNPDKQEIYSQLGRLYADSPILPVLELIWRKEWLHDTAHSCSGHPAALRKKAHRAYLHTYIYQDMADQRREVFDALTAVSVPVSGEKFQFRESEYMIPPEAHPRNMGKTERALQIVGLVAKLPQYYDSLEKSRECEKLLLQYWNEVYVVLEPLGLVPKELTTRDFERRTGWDTWVTVHPHLF